jgi:hypothetical protein
MELHLPPPILPDRKDLPELMAQLDHKDLPD